MSGHQRERLRELLAGEVASSPAAARIASAARSTLKADHIGLSIVTAHLPTSHDCSDRLGMLLDEQQFGLADGPTFAATRTDTPVVATHLPAARGRRRWPLFAPVAAEFDVGSAVAIPLQVGVVQVGVLTAYRRHEPGPDEAAFSDAVVLAGLAAHLLVEEWDSAEDPALSHLGLGGSRGQAVVHQAAGMLSEQLGISVVEALVRLRAHATAARLPLATVGRSIVVGELALER